MKRFLVIIPVFLFILLGACGDTSRQGLDPSIHTFVAQTQTATVWTPAPATPSATHIPKQAFIVKTLNDELRREADPLEETLDVKFSILDVSFDRNGKPPKTTTITIHVECEWIKDQACTKERAFIALANAFAGLKPDARKKLVEQIPVTINTVQIRAFDHVTTQIGIVEVSWDCLLQFADGDITGDQLAARTLMLAPPMP